MAESVTHEPSRRNPIIKRLATGFVVAAAAFGSSVGLADATNYNRHWSPERLTRTEKKLNRKAQLGVNNLVHSIVNGPVDKRGGAGTAVTPNGRPAEMRGISVPAPNLESSAPGAYYFTVIAPVSPSGAMELNKAFSLTLQEGDATTVAGVSTTPDVELTFERNQQTGGAWAVKGNYQSPKTGSPYVIEAGVKPQLPHEAPLTDLRLHDSFQQAWQLVGDALVKKPVADEEAAFFQPAGTQINPLK